MQAFTPYFPALFVVLWATGFVGARYAMPYAEPFTFLALRFMLAAALLAAAVVTVRLRWPPARDAAKAIVAGILIHGIYLGPVFWAIHNGMPAGLTALIIGLQPLVTALAAWMLLSEPLTRRLLVGLGFGFAGLAMVLAPALSAAPHDTIAAVTPANFAACIVAVLGISFGTVWQKRHAAAIDLRAGNMWQYVGAAGVCGLAALGVEHGTIVWAPQLLFALAWLTLVLSIGAVFLLMFLIREGAVSKVSSLFFLVPGVTAVMAWALFGENLTWLQVVGLVVASGGVWLATGQASLFARKPR